MSSLLDANGLPANLKFFVRALLDWVSDDTIAIDVCRSGRATATGLAALRVRLATHHNTIGLGMTPEFWQAFETDVMFSLYTFVQDRKTRRLIAKRMEKLGVNPKDARKDLEGIRVELEARFG